jgi:hypothetical protein
MTTCESEYDRPSPVRFEHDPAGRVFRLAAADDRVEAFPDNPTRYQCVEGGPMQPVAGRRQPPSREAIDDQGGANDTRISMMM